MNELIKVAEKDGKQSVSAKDLHMALEVKRDFSTWIKDRIEKYGFVEGEDFSPNLAQGTEKEPNLIFPKFGENQTSGRGGKREGAGRPVIDYLLSVGMAKEIAVVENNEKGREIRRQLIKIEEAWNEPRALIRRALQTAWGIRNSVPDRGELVSRELRKTMKTFSAAWNALSKERVSWYFKKQLEKPCEHLKRLDMLLSDYLITENDMLFERDAYYRKLLRICYRLGIEPEDVPPVGVINDEWPHFPGLYYPDAPAESLPIDELAEQYGMELDALERDSEPLARQPSLC